MTSGSHQEDLLVTECLIDWLNVETQGIYVWVHILEPEALASHSILLNFKVGSEPQPASSAE